jgi:hypothetical protein
MAGSAGPPPLVSAPLVAGSLSAGLEATAAAGGSDSLSGASTDVASRASGADDEHAISSSTVDERTRAGFQLARGDRRVKNGS